MSKLAPEQWHVDRARRAQELMRQLTVEGVTGNDDIPPVTLPTGTEYPSTDDAAVNRGVRRMAYALFGAQQHGPWVDMELGAGWSRYATTHTPPQYRERGDGDWEIRGFIAGGGVGAGNFLFTLPEPAWPTWSLNLPLITSTGVGRLEIDAQGRIAVISGGNTWASLDSIRWSPLG